MVYKNTEHASKEWIFILSNQIYFNRRQRIVGLCPLFSWYYTINLYIKPRNELLTTSVEAPILGVLKTPS